MRGKLRDKRSVKRDIFKRDEMERRRPGKRDNRSLVKLSLQMEEDDYTLDIDDEEDAEEEQAPKIKAPRKK